MASLIIYLQVKTNKKVFLIEPLLEENKYIIHTTCLPENNRCNQEIIYELSKFFKKSKNEISIIKGLKSKNKILKINDIPYV
jgi:uncharacterized protein YggU (UPF0235/DUF167 family)